MAELAESDPQSELQTGARGLGARFWTLIAATFLAFIGIGTVLPGMAIHVRHDLGGSDRTVGFVIGTFSVIALCSRVISGPLTDRRGRKVAFMTGLCRVFRCGAGVSFTARFIGNVFRARHAGLWRSVPLYGSRSMGRRKRGSASVTRAGLRLYGNLGRRIGWASGRPMGGDVSTCSDATSDGGNRGLALIWRIPENYELHPNPRARRWLPKELIAPGIAIGFVNIHYPVVTGFLILHMAQTGGPGPTAFSAYALMVLMSRFFFGGLPDRVLLPAHVLRGSYEHGVTGLSIALVPGPVTSLIGAIFLGLGFAFPWSSVASTVLKRTRAAEHGRP